MLFAAAVAALIVFPAVAPAAGGPTASLTATPSTGKAPLQVTFDASGSSDANGTITSWSIDFGDGSSDSGTGLPPSSDPHTYAVGTYTATLTVTDDSPATDSASLTVNSKANVAPNAVLTSSPTPATGKAPLSVTFNGSGSSDSDGSIASWTLDFGDGSTVAGGNGAPPASKQHSYAAGTYTAKLTVTDDDGATDSASLAVNSKANVAPNAVLTSSPTPATGKAPFSVTFNGSGSSDSDGSIASWTLDFGDGSTVAGRQRTPPASKQHSYAAGNVHGQADGDRRRRRDRLRVAGRQFEGECRAHRGAHLVAHAGDGQGAAERHLQRLGQLGFRREHRVLDTRFGDGSTVAGGNGTPPSSLPHSYAAGTYTAKLTVIDDNGASGTASVAVNANAPPTAVLTENKTAPGPAAVSLNGSGSSDSDGSIASWNLDFGDGNSQSGSGAPPADIPHTYATAGSYTAKLTVTDNQGAVSNPLLSKSSSPRSASATSPRTRATPARRTSSSR